MCTEREAEKVLIQAQGSYCSDPHAHETKSHLIVPSLRVNIWTHCADWKTWAWPQHSISIPRNHVWAAFQAFTLRMLQLFSSPEWAPSFYFFFPFSRPKREKIGLYSPNEEQWATEEEDIWTEENRETRRTKKGHELMNLFRKMAASGGDKNSSSERTSDYTERSPIFGDSFREKEEREKTSHVVVFLCVETCFLGIFLFSRFLIISFWGSI